MEQKGANVSDCVTVCSWVSAQAGHGNQSYKNQKINKKQSEQVQRRQKLDEK